MAVVVKGGGESWVVIVVVSVRDRGWVEILAVKAGYWCWGELCSKGVPPGKVVPKGVHDLFSICPLYVQSPFHLPYPFWSRPVSPYFPPHSPLVVLSSLATSSYGFGPPPVSSYFPRDSPPAVPSPPANLSIFIQYPAHISPPSAVLGLCSVRIVLQTFSILKGVDMAGVRGRGHDRGWRQGWSPASRAMYGVDTAVKPGELSASKFHRRR